MKVYKITLMVVDHNRLGPDALVEEIENVRYPNRCILCPAVIGIEDRDIGEWQDDNPLNYLGKRKGEFERLFGEAARHLQSTLSEPRNT